MVGNCETVICRRIAGQPGIITPDPGDVWLRENSWTVKSLTLSLCL
jgi:hypothetical protein